MWSVPASPTPDYDRHTPQEYHLRLARVALSNHGLNPERPEALAQWALYAVARGYTNRGVLVTADARLRAETILPPMDPSIAPSWRNILPPWAIVARTWPGGDPPTGPHALGEAMDTIRAATGLPIAHIPYREVCTGWAG